MFGIDLTIIIIIAVLALLAGICALFCVSACIVGGRADAVNARAFAEHQRHQRT